MARQYILAGFPQPIFINETSSLDYILPGVYVNETSGSSGARPNRLPYLGVGAVEPGPVDLLVSGALFAGLIVKQNPVTGRRKLFTLGIKGASERG